jgi:FkbM family methyltransferase
MLFNFLQLQQEYNLKIKDIIHVGGHFGEEVKIYKDGVPDRFIEIFEPHPITFQYLLKTANTFNNINCHNVALGSQEKTMTLYVENANNGQSNSLLKPKVHTQQYPHIIFNETVNVNVKTLDSFNYTSNFNFLNIDVQGFELEVLKGSVTTLQHIECIICEVNNVELYENCCKVGDIDNFLEQFNFKRVKTNWEGTTWGDALYVKSRI